eukprot:COSAG02_NODE_1986_length_10180_cov_38.805575_8_plen_79_part_00
MDIPALGRDSVIFESFSFISLDSIMDSIDSSQIPVLIGRSVFVSQLGETGSWESKRHRGTQLGIGTQSKRYPHGAPTI